MQSLKNLDAGGVKKPAAQSESPYCFMQTRKFHHHREINVRLADDLEPDLGFSAIDRARLQWAMASLVEGLV